MEEYVRGRIRGRRMIIRPKRWGWGGEGANDKLFLIRMGENRKADYVMKDDKVYPGIKNDETRRSDVERGKKEMKMKCKKETWERDVVIHPMIMILHDAFFLSPLSTNSRNWFFSSRDPQYIGFTLGT